MKEKFVPPVLEITELLVFKGFNGNPEALGEATVNMQKLKYEIVSLMQLEI